MSLVTYDPFQTFGQMRQDMDQMFGHLMGSGQREASRWAPRVDIREDGESITLQADLPGMKQEEIKVNVEDGHLTISGERREEKSAKDQKGNVHRRERVYGTFQRTFQLPDFVDVAKISASYENGVLALTIPKEERVKPRQIEVKIGA